MGNDMDRIRSLKRIVGVAGACLALAVWANELDSGDRAVANLVAKIESKRPAASAGQSATQLSDGRWLLAGGRDETGRVTGRLVLLDRKFTPIASPVSRLSVARTGHSATALADGSVLIIGGSDVAGQPVATLERFRPDTQEAEAVGDVGLEARVGHTATLLMDGRVLVLGGKDVSALVRHDAQLLDPRTWRIETVSSGLAAARFQHLAALLPSDDVLIWSGKDQSGAPILPAELYRRNSSRFEPLADTARLVDRPYSASAPSVRGSLPTANATDVTVDALLAVRFSKPLSPETLNASSVTLLGPAGTVESRVAAAEGGLLVFVTPNLQLLPGSHYTLFIRGARDPQERPLPFTAIGFETRALKPLPRSAPLPIPRPRPAELSDADGEIWVPGAQNFSGAWRSGNGHRMPRELPKRATVAKALFGKQVEDRAPQLPPGVTALAGQVLKLNSTPLANVTLSIGNRKTKTDANGEFLLRDIPAGTQTLVIDGGSADSGKRQYGRYEYRADIEARKLNALPFVIWMTRLDLAHEVSIPSPTASETIITNPRIPGLELHIPKDTVIRDAEGRIVTSVSMTAIPVDQPPFPLPNSFVPVYFTVQPGGAHLEGLNLQAAKGARLIYPNYSNAEPGSRMDFWNYDSREKGWYVYGQGTVSEDGKQIVPDEGVVIYEFAGAMVASPSFAPEEGPGNCASGGAVGGGGPAEEGDPVDCYTGLFMHRRTDLQIADIIPLSVYRIYRPRDSASRAFGIGTTLSYDMFLVGTTVGYTYQDLILPDGGRLHYTRTSAGTSWTDAVYISNTVPGPYFGSTIRWSTAINAPVGGWQLELTDGTVYLFPEASRAPRPQCAALQAIRDRNGNTVTMTRNTSCYLTQVTSHNGRHLNFVYNGANRITQVSDDIGRTVTYQYDGSGRLTLVTYPDTKTESYTYDTQHRMLTVTDRRGNVMVTNVYDANGRVTQQTYADNKTSSFAYTLDSNNKVTQTEYTNERGVIKRIQFHASGLPATIIQAVGKPEQRTTTFVRNASTNLVESQTDPLGRQTTYQYDAKGNVTQVTYLAGTPNATTWTYTYEPKFSRVTSVTDPLNHVTTYNYDLFGNLTSVVDALNHAVQYTYTDGGRIATASRTVGGSPVTMTYTWIGGDLASITDPLGRTTQFFADQVGRVASVKDPAGNVQRISHDVLDRVTQTTDALGHTTESTYDGNGNLLTFEDGKSNLTQFSYDVRNRMSSKTDPLNKVESYLYDDIGNRTRVTDRNGLVSGYGYDFLDRVTSAGFGATASSPTAFTSTVAYTWDAGNRLTDAVDSISGTISRDFDGLNRLTQELSPQGQIDYTYYANGLRQTMTVQGQSAVTYSYDNANRLTQIAQGSTNVGFTYDAVDRRSTLTLPNGIVVTYGYDDASQLTSLAYQKNSTMLGTLTYGYDLAGRRTSMGGTLAQVNLPAAVASTVHDAANRVTNWGSHTMTYDDNGALISDADSTTLSYVWDERQRLKEIIQGSTTTASFQYDAFNRRIGKTIGGVSTNLLNDDWQIVQELSGTTPTANLLTGLRIDEIFRRTAGTTVEDFLVDALGSTVALTDATGTVQTTYSYEPYGGTSSAGSSTGSVSQYTGRENDGDLYYYRARYYSPTLNRFISEDPIGLLGGPNTYAYVEGNPLRYTDSFGLAIGDLPPAPPGYDPATWERGVWDSGRPYVRDPITGDRYTAHPEDASHWRHWDKEDGGRWPPNSKKPWPNQKRGLKKDQCASDPSGDAPPWEGPPDLMVPWLSPEYLPTRTPVEPIIRFRIPFRIPFVVP
jgi:RHS repeat-associated protein